MAEDESKPKGPDFTKGIALASLAENEACLPAMPARMTFCLCAGVTMSSHSLLIAPTITDPSPTGSWLAR